MNGVYTVRLNLIVGGHTGQHILNNGLWRLGARIVAGDNQPVRILTRRAPHLGALADIAVTACAKHHPQLPRAMRPGRRQTSLQAVSGMGIVNQDRGLLGHPLHTPWNGS